MAAAQVGQPSLDDFPVDAVLREFN